MATCETCGNNYAKSFEITMNGKTHTFDSFECAIQNLAPACTHCGCRILGHGAELDGMFFCCNHCLRQGKMHHGDKASLMSIGYSTPEQKIPSIK